VTFEHKSYKHLNFTIFSVDTMLRNNKEKNVLEISLSNFILADSINVNTS